MTPRFALPVKLALLGLVPLTAIAGLAAWRVADDFADADSFAAQADEVRRVDRVSQVIDDIDDEIQMLGELGASEVDLVAQREQVDRSLESLLSEQSGTSAATRELASSFRSRIDALRAAIPPTPTSYRSSGAAVARRAFDHGDGGIDAMTPAAVAIHDATVEFDEFTSALRAATQFDDDLFRDGGVATDVSTLQLLDRLAAQLDTERQIYVEMASLAASLRTEAVIEAGLGVGRTSEFWEEALDEIGADGMLDGFAAVQSSEPARAVAETRALMSSIEPGQPLAISAADIEEDFVDLDTQIGALRAQLSAETIAAVDSISASAQRSAYITMALAALFVGGAAALTFLLYLSIRRPLQRVTQRSIDVASVQLPAIVAQLREDPDAELSEIEPMPVETRDEIGQLVEAFNTMSATSLELAGEQAIARRSVGDMFMNLGRRNQKLLNRLLRSLDQLQRDERDPEALRALYEIDHLTTRMRRNAESLLILAGAEQTRRFSSPVTAGDIIRGAMSEVEHYERVEIVGDTGQRIRGEFVADLTHLLAEVIENGLVFSPPETTVQVTARMTHRGYMFAVSDDGVGMTAEKIDEANHRISSAATQEETPSTLLGLFVVGRLAARRNVDVRVFDSPTGGVAVRLALPDEALYVDDSMVPEPSEIAGMSGVADENSDPAPRDDRTVTVVPDTIASIVEADAHAHADHAGAGADAAREPTASDVPEISVPVTSLDEIPASRRPAVRSALDSLGRISASITPVDFGSSAAVGDPAQPLAAPVGSSLPAPTPPQPTKFGVAARTPGANLPETALTAGSSTTPSGPDGAVADRDPDAVRNTLSSFQAGTNRADRQGADT